MFKQYIGAMLFILGALFTHGCANSGSTNASVRKSWFYLGGDGLSIGPSLEMSTSSSQSQHFSEAKYENAEKKEHVYMSSGRKNTEQTRPNTTINVSVDNSQKHIDQSSNTLVKNESITQITTTNKVDASSSVVDNSTNSRDDSVNVNSNNSNSKVNSENRRP